jgi:thioredoxin 1
VAPVVDRLTTEYEGKVEILRMNVETDDDAAALASEMRVQYVPTFVLLNSDGTTADTLIGELSESALKTALDSLK